MNVYYNENDSKAASWLHALMDAGHIPAGELDTRSIVDVRGLDLVGYDQCHFFAGIGGWPYALDLAGWSGPVWTGSCPCQPFSAAGMHKGTADERHLWPEFQRLIAERSPPIVFGEQVASKDGRLWLAGVRADLEALGYAVGAADLCAAGVGAPHIRQRLFWLGHTEGDSQRQRGIACTRDEPQKSLRGSSLLVGMADADGWNTEAEGLQRGGQHGQRPQDSGACLGLGNASGSGLEGRSLPERGRAGQRAAWPTDGDACWLPCLDGKARRIEPGSFPLAHGVPARVGRLRGYGNAIVPQCAQAFIEAYMSIVP